MHLFHPNHRPQEISVTPLLLYDGRAFLQLLNLVRTEMNAVYTQGVEVT